MSSWIDRAKQVMLEKQVTQQDLVTVLKVGTRGAVGHYFTGRSEPSLDQFGSLAKHLGVSLPWLISGQEQTSVPINAELLTDCIQVADHSSLPPRKKAHLIAYLYEKAIEGTPVDPQQVSDLIRIFSA
jgi:transcriptional regulator with XRE-family HTH domain